MIIADCPTPFYIVVITLLLAGVVALDARHNNCSAVSLSFFCSQQQQRQQLDQGDGMEAVLDTAICPSCGYSRPSAEHCDVAMAVLLIYRWLISSFFSFLSAVLLKC